MTCNELLIVLDKPCASPKPILDSEEPSRKRERSGSLPGLSSEETWVEFQHFMVLRSLSYSQSPRGHHS